MYTHGLLFEKNGFWRGLFRLKNHRLVITSEIAVRKFERKNLLFKESPEINSFFIVIQNGMVGLMAISLNRIGEQFKLSISKLMKNHLGTKIANEPSQKFTLDVTTNKLVPVAI